MTKKETITFDMRSIISNSIINGAGIPLEMTKIERENFAQEIAKICDKRSFDKSRDAFKKEVDKVIQLAINKCLE